MALIKVYLIDGKHIDVEVKKEERSVAEVIAESGCWSKEREEDIFYPAHQILKVRLCKDKVKVKA